MPKAKHQNANQILPLFEAGYSYKQISQRLAMHCNTVRRHIHAAGKRRGRGYRGSAEQRFWNNVLPEPNSGCWLWCGDADQNGYGSLSVKNIRRQATHVALNLHGQEIPAGKLVCHHCDNPYCVNPGHLFIGSHKDNVQDMINKNRHKFYFTRKSKT